MYVKNVAKPTQPKKNKLAPPNFLACLTETLNAFLLNYNALFLSILLSRWLYIMKTNQLITTVYQLSDLGHY